MTTSQSAVSWDRIGRATSFLHFGAPIKCLPWDGHSSSGICWRSTTRRTVQAATEQRGWWWWRPCSGGGVPKRRHEIRRIHERLARNSGRTQPYCWPLTPAVSQPVTCVTVVIGALAWMHDSSWRRSSTFHDDCHVDAGFRQLVAVIPAWKSSLLSTLFTVCTTAVSPCQFSHSLS